MRIHNDSILAAGNMSGNLTSDSTPLDHIYGFAIQCVFTGSPVGTLKLQSSCDLPNTTPVNWTDVSGSEQSISAAGSHVWNFSGLFADWVRVVYTRTSGSGTLNVRINMKGS